MTAIRSDTRYAPTLIIGLGGSGVAIVGITKRRILGDRGLTGRPVEFLGIDLDASSQDDRLSADEFLRLRGYTARATERDDRVLDWLPIDSPFRDPQALQYGAGRHRHVGHIASAVHRRTVVDAIRRATSRLAIASHQSMARTFVVASLAGGTGSGMLFDVAAALHEIRFPGSVDAVLLLPEVFSDVSLPRSMLPIAYGTIVELAALESYRLTLPSIEPTFAPFERVYLQGPWIGARSALDQSATFEAIAERIEAMSLASIRRQQVGVRVNADERRATQAATASVFSTVTKTGLRLLHHRTLATAIVGSFLRNMRDGHAGMFDVAGVETSATVVARDLERAATSSRPLTIERAAEQFVEEKIDKIVQNPKLLHDLPTDLAAFCGLDEVRTAEWLKNLRPEVEDDLRFALQELRRKLALRPRAFERLLGELSTLLQFLLPPITTIPSRVVVENLDEITRSWLPRSFLVGRIRATKDHLLVELRKESDTLARRLILKTANDLVAELLDSERRYWTSLDQLYRLWQQSNNDNGDAERILHLSLAELEPSASDAFKTRFLSEFNAFYARYSTRRDPSELDAWMSMTRDMFADSFKFPFVAPSILYSEYDVKSAIMQLDSGVFIHGRANESDAQTLVTLVMPKGFRGREDFTRGLAEMARTMLAANVVVEQVDRDTDDEIILLLESHCHSPASIRGIRDYESEYRREPDPTAYHFDKTWPLLLADFIDSLSIGRTSSSGRSEFPRRFDIGLVIPLHEEFEIVESHWPVRNSATRAGTTFLELDMSAAGVTCVATVLREMGPSVAASRTEKLLNFADVSLVVLLGIAGALNSDVELTDIVIADEVAEFNAASKAVPAGEGSFKLQYSGFHFRAQYPLIDAIAHWPYLAKEDYLDWKQAVRVKVPSLGNGRPHMHIEHVASGDTVGAADAFRVELLGIDRKFSALEMEGAGVARAAETRQPSVPFMIIRGISDYSDKRKKALDRTERGVWRSLAVHSACDALARLLRLPAVRSAAKL